MALRKMGSVWVMYWNEDGKRIQRSTGCTDEANARFIERQVMNRRRMVRACRRLGVEAKEDAVQFGSRFPISRMLKVASSKEDISREVRIHWERFVESCGMSYADEVTLQAAERYLTRECEGKSAKTYNNLKGYLGKVFRLCESTTGVTSPFTRIINRKNRDANHHRAYTDAEVRRILRHCTPYWAFMVRLSYYTGMSREMCNRFSSEHIVDIDGRKWARFVRSKTARFGRACLVPLRDEVLSMLPESPPGKPFADAFGESAHQRQNGFRFILAKAGVTANADGMADFHSLRATFISRCREAGMLESAIRSMVGHVKSETTDLYSHDTVSPLALLDVKCASI